MIKVYRLSKVLIVLCLFAAVAAAAFFLHTQEEKMGVYMSAEADRLPVLVIDPGHGGEDGGAVSVTGTHESVINLDIAERVAAFAELTGLPYKMTRQSQNIEYPSSLKSISKRKLYDQKARVALINGTPNALLLSIHQNFYPKKSAHGPQAFYAKTEGSDVLAGFLCEGLDAALLPGNKRPAKPIAKNIFLMKNVNCPAVLVECGFLSNGEEARLLDTNDYRLRVATSLAGAYLRYLNDRGKQ